MPPNLRIIRDVLTDPIARRNLIGLILCGTALSLDVSMSFSTMSWFHRSGVADFDHSTGSYSFAGRKLDIDISELFGQAPSNFKREDFNLDDLNSYHEMTGWHGHGRTHISLRITIYVGLWQSCLKMEVKHRDPITTCWMHDDEDFRFFGVYQIERPMGMTQIFQCLGLLFLAVAVAAFFLKLWILKENNILVPLGVSHAFWGGLSFIGSAGAFGVGLKKASTSSIDLTKDLNFSFYFAVISGIIALAGALVPQHQCASSATKAKSKKTASKSKPQKKLNSDGNQENDPEIQNESEENQENDPEMQNESDENQENDPEMQNESEENQEIDPQMQMESEQNQALELQMQMESEHNQAMELQMQMASQQNQAIEMPEM